MHLGRGVGHCRQRLHLAKLTLVVLNPQVSLRWIDTLSWKLRARGPLEWLRMPPQVDSPSSLKWTSRGYQGLQRTSPPVGPLPTQPSQLFSVYEVIAPQEERVVFRVDILSVLACAVPQLGQDQRVFLVGPRILKLSEIPPIILNFIPSHLTRTQPLSGPFPLLPGF